MPLKVNNKLQYQNKVLIIRPNTTYRARTTVFLINYNMIRLSRLAIASQGVWICVSLRSALRVDLTDVPCEDSSITHIFIFYPFIIFYLIFTPFILRFHILYLRNSATWFVLYSSFTNRCTFNNSLIKIYIKLDGCYMFRSVTITRELAIESG